MRKLLFVLFVLIKFSELSVASDRPLNLISPPASQTENSITLCWNKPAKTDSIKAYEIYCDDEFVGISYKTNYTVKKLLSGTTYRFYVKSKYKSGKTSSATSGLTVATRPKGEKINVTDYGAVGDGVTLNTEFIQRAIDECPEGGIVHVPQGTFLSGALFLKSNMTLYIANGGTLEGSIYAKHYKPFILNRFEGWETLTYASLLNAGTLNRDGTYSIENLSIRGEGAIKGGGMALGGDMIASKGMRGRGRLICLMNCKNVNIQGLTIEESPCWTIHYIYCKNVTLHDLIINSKARNGDGIDPDSSVDSYIFNCVFNTNDDCIAIKSGKNPEGNYIGKPTENVFISHCEFVKGHGISIGSEMSGGVRNVVITDCIAGNLMHGMQIKATKDRGGFVENVVVKDCELHSIRIFTSVNYNNDGDPAPDLPHLREFTFSSINMSESKEKPVITVQGFNNPLHYTENVLFENIVLPDNASIKIDHSKNITFNNVRTLSGSAPEYHSTNTINIKK